MAVVTTEIVKQVALLARLRLDGPALQQFAEQMDEILAYVQQLQAVPTESVEPTTHVVPLSNVLRADEPQPSLSLSAVLAMANAQQPPFIKVPKVIDA